MPQQDTTPMKNTAALWISAFNLQDIDKLLALYHINATHLSPRMRQQQPETEGLIVGHENLRTWWSSAFMRTPSLRYSLSRITCGESHLFIEYTRSAENELKQKVAELLEFDGPLICHSRVFNS